MPYSEADIQLLAKCMWLEARGEGIDGMYAVGHCVANRIGAPGFPKTWSEVILSPNQFSWTRPDDPQYGKVPPSGDPIFQMCLEDAEFILAGDPDITRGAKYYANELEVGPDSWYRKHIIDSPDHPVTTIVGKHTFRV